MRQLDIPDLLETQYKTYSYYVLESRAIPHIVDGMKPVQRRALFSAMKLCYNDPVKVVKQEIINAVSTAGILITFGAAIINQEEKKV